MARSAMLGAVLLAGETMAQVAGNTPGEFSVDPTGAATYRIPLVVPSGTAGMQPDLALLYHSRSGNGQLGVGWSVSGLSAITRCPAIRDAEGVAHVGGVTLSPADRFCLDGQPLRHQAGSYGADGTVYYTEIQSFQAVRSHGSSGGAPTHFTVADRAGLTRHYGQTSDSRITSVGGTSGVPITWALNRIEDKHGNFISFTYGRDPTLGEYWPAEIRWSNNLSQVLGRVVFGYSTARPDKTYGYGYGRTRLSLTRRLNHIQVYEGASVGVRRYALTYQQGTVNQLSYLGSVQECAGIGSPCLPATEFAWTQGEQGWLLSGAPKAADGGAVKWLDVNGDGRLDAVRRSSGSLRIYLAANNGSSVTSSVPAGSHLRFDEALVLDYDGDGRMDLLVANTSTGHWDVYRSTGSNFSYLQTGRPHFGAHTRYPVAFDITGNGVPELFFKHQGRLHYYRGLDGGGFAAAAVMTGWTVGDAQRLLPMQFDGDGRPDLFISFDGCTVDGGGGGGGGGGGVHLLADPGGSTLAAWSPAEDTGTQSSSSSTCAASAGPLTWNPATGIADAHRLHRPWPNSGAHQGRQPIALDIDGDGLTDLVSLDLFTQALAVRLNRGGYFETVWSGLNEAGWHKAMVLDWNHDGRDELLVPATNGQFVALSYRNNSIEILATALSAGHGAYFAGDWNGNGLADIYYLNSGAWRVWPRAGERAGHLARIRNGLGNELSVAYAALSRHDPGYTLYTGHEPGDAPTGTPRIRHFLGPIVVVERFAADSGINDASGQPQKVVTQYRYAGAKVNQYGRGFLGFRRMLAYNQNTGIVTENLHAQEFPYTGMVVEATRRMPDVTAVEWLDGPCPPLPAECMQPPPVETISPGPLVEQTSNIVARKLLGSGAAQVQWPFIATSTESHHELGSGGSVYRRIVTSYSYDQHGNATQVAVTTDNGAGGDRHTTTTINSWQHTEACPSRLTQSLVTQTAPSADGHGPLTRQRSASFDYHPTHCQLTSETSNAGTAAALTKNIGYDTFGNRIVETITGYDISPARSSTKVYDAKGRYPIHVINALGHVQSFTWQQGLGVRLSATDPDGLTTRWQYDAFGRETKVTAPRTTQYTDSARAWCGSGGCQHPEAVMKVTRTGSGGVTEQSFSVTEIDRLGREVATGERNVQGQLVYALTFFDPAGRPYANSGPYRPGLDIGACWNVRHYDPLGRLRHEYASADPSHCGSLAVPPPETAPSGWSHTRTTYSGLATTVTDPEGRQRQRIVNVMDRLRFARDHDGTAWRQTEYQYDGHGNATRILDPAGAITTSVFDTAGRKISMAEPNMGSWSYAYNAAGELIAQTDAKGVTTAMTYDVLGRIRTRVEPDGTTLWLYDSTVQGPARGKLTHITGPHNYQERFWYDTIGGELRSSARFIGDQWFWTHFEHNALGQVSQVRYPAVNCAAPCSSAPPDAGRLRVDQYYRYGHLYLVRERRPDGTAGTPYWEVLEVDALGTVTREKLGNILFTQRYVSPATGLVESIVTGTHANATSVQDLALDWDRVGNLRQRADYRANRREDLGYDGLGRLSGVSLRTTSGTLLGSEAVQYSSSGNILGKGSYTGYKYLAQRPNGVSSVTTPAGTRGYSYDANGNLTAVTGPGARTVNWWSFNKPRRMQRDVNNYSEYWYGPGGDRALFRQSARINGQLELTLYGAALYERRIVGASVVHTHYVQANGTTVATVRRSGTGVANTTRYLHRDHLGSVVAITSESGSITESLAYDAWGKRRPASTWQTPNPGVFIASAWQRRGFTSHEHIDHVGLIHMGGRVYDPEIGRFLSPDPFVQFPASTQGFNRYAYVGNNPLSYTDPSGYFLKELGKVVGIAMNLVPGMQLTNVWLHGFVSGFLASGGQAKSGLMGMMSAGIANQVGALADAHKLNDFSRAALHGVTQGAIARAGGGRFGDGALGAFSGSILAFIPEAVAGPYGTGGEAARIGRMVAAAAVGGTASKIGGGKFANGAWSAAFVSRFNHDGRHVFQSVTVNKQVHQVAYHSDGLGNRACGTNTDCLSRNLDLDENHPKTVAWQKALHAKGAGEVATMLALAPVAAPTVRILGGSNFLFSFLRATVGDFGGVVGQIAGLSFRYRAVQLGAGASTAVRVDAVTGAAVDHAWTNKERQ
jgi:RHS repeat-associated protein